MKSCREGDSQKDERAMAGCFNSIRYRTGGSEHHLAEQSIEFDD
jgi:hypothetical protein